MPLMWPAPPPAVLQRVLEVPAIERRQEQQAPVTHKFGDLVVIEAQNARFTEDEAIFEKGVRAQYGLDTLTADSLHVHRTQMRATAAGNVVLRSPEGTLSARDLEMSWDPANKHGTARDVRIEIANVLLEAETAEIVLGDEPYWSLRNLRGTTCPDDTPLYLIRSDRLVVYPGRHGSLRRPRIEVLGKHVITLPTRRFSLDPRVGGFNLPGLNFKSEGVGLRWNFDILLNERTALGLDARAFKGEPFALDLRVTRSMLDPMSPQAPITPSSDAEERFRDGYFNNIHVSDPASETRRASASKRVVSLGTTWNYGSANDQLNDRYTTLLELLAEEGGKLGGLGHQTTLRAQRIRREDGPYHNRFVARTTAVAPTLDLGSGFYGRFRLDAAAFMGGSDSHWLRGEGGLIWAPTKQVMIGAAIAEAMEGGTALFPADGLFAKRSAHYRVDLDLGPTRLGFLYKEDLDDGRRISYDYYLRQVMGCMEAFVVYREFPSSYQIGLSVRLDAFWRAIRNPSYKRQSVDQPKDERLFVPEPRTEPQGGAEPEAPQ